MHSLIFHQIFMTFLGFGVFLIFFRLLFYNLIENMFFNRLQNTSMLQSLIEKNSEDKEFFHKESILFNKLRKDKIDNYVLTNLLKSNDKWNNEIVQLKAEIEACKSHAKVELSEDEMGKIIDLTNSFKGIYYVR